MAATNVFDLTKPAFTCSKSTTKTPNNLWNMFKVNIKDTRTSLMDVNICHVRETRQHTISESLKFTGSIYRIWKNKKNYFPPESFIDKAIELNWYFVPWQISSKAAASKKNLKKSKNYFAQKNLIDNAIQSNRSLVLWQIPFKIIC